jgi:arylsulfatase A
MLLTGLYPNRTGYLTLMMAEDKRLPADLKTFGHYFRDAGYEIGIAGKWQLGRFKHYPNQTVEHGFNDYCMWTYYSESGKTSRYYKPCIYQAEEFTQGSGTDYGPDFFSKHILDFIKQNKDKPFLAYYPMALVHSPFIDPPGLNEIADKKLPADLTDKTRSWGRMITYMDTIIGEILDELKTLGLDKNTLVLFMGDNGTHTAITSKLPGMNLKGGKGSMTEAGTRVPFIAWWPGTIQPGVRDEFFCLIDVLPTITSIAGIPLTTKVDGMDLSHILLGKSGQDREYIKMAFKTGFFVRNKRFRLSSDGTFYDIPVTSNQERYSEKESTNPEYASERQRLQKVLDDFMAINPQVRDRLLSKNSEDKKSKKGDSDQ